MLDKMTKPNYVDIDVHECSEEKIGLIRYESIRHYIINDKSSFFWRMTYDEFDEFVDELDRP